MVMTKKNTEALVPSEPNEVKRGYRYAVNMTIDIAQHLPNKENKASYKKTVRSIFDDMLKENTYFNRQQRHESLKKLDVELKKLLK